MVTCMGDIEALDAVQELSGLWPKDRNESEASIRARLKGKIVDDLPLPSLRTAPGGWRILAPPLIRGDICKCAVSEGQYPFACAMAEMRHRANGWVLTAFEPQCPVCFGTGINNGCLCDFCFGLGWGVQCHDYKKDNAVAVAVEDYLRRGPVGSWRVACEPLTYSGKAKCLLTSTHDSSIPALMELEWKGSDWIVTSLEQQCPDCAGAGLKDISICDRCFGTGWGT